MSEQVVIGTLKQPFDVRAAGALPNPEISEWSHRAMWSYIRLQYGKTKADAEIKQHFDVLETMKGETLTREERKKEMQIYFVYKVNKQGDPKKLQFILDGKRVMAVASLKHLLVPPAEVYSLAKQIVREKFPENKHVGVKQLAGLTYKVKHVAGITFGVQIFGGDITTRKAITLTSWMRVQGCFNPLSWLGFGNFKSFGISNGKFERVLRIKVKDDLKKRLQTAIQNSMKQVANLDQRISEAKSVPMKKDEAAIIASAFGLSWSVGEKVILQVLKRYQQEAQSQWGLSMALSYIAAHGKFRKVPKGCTSDVAQNLSTMAGASMLMKDKNYTKQQCIEWLRSHIKEGQLASVQKILRKIAKGK